MDESMNSTQRIEGSPKDRAESSRNKHGRRSVLDRTHIVLDEINGAVATLNSLWDEIDMDAEKRLTRINIAYSHITKLLTDMVSSEHAAVAAVQAQIEENTNKIAEIRKELGMPPFNMNAYREGSIVLWKALEADVKILGEERDTLIQEQKTLIDRFGHLTSRLGSDLSDETCASLPDSSVLAPRATVAELRDRCVKMEHLVGQRMDRVLEVQKEMLEWIGRMNCDYSEDVAAVLEVDARAPESALTADLMDQLTEIRQTMADAYSEWLTAKDAEYQESIARLQELWEMCCVNEEERRLPAVFDPALLDSLEEAKAEVERLERTYEQRRGVYDAIGAWKALWAEKLQYESSESSLEKYNNRGGSLDQRIKHEARLNKQLLPAASHAVAEAYSAFLAASPGEKIFVEGMEPLAFIRHTTSEHDLEKEMEKEQKMQARKAQLQQEIKWGSTPAAKTPLGRRPLAASASASRVAPAAKMARIAGAGDDVANFTFDQSAISAISPTKRGDKLFPKTSSPKGSRVTVAPGTRFTPAKATPKPTSQTPKRPLAQSNKK